MPFLVANNVSGFGEPILGYNIVQCILQDTDVSNCRRVLEDCLCDGEIRSKVNKISREMCKSSAESFVCNVNVGRQTLKIPQQTSVKISVFFKGKRYHEKIVTMF